MLFLYNTGARVQEVADLRHKNLELDGNLGFISTGKGTNGGSVRCGRRP